MGVITKTASKALKPFYEIYQDSKPPLLLLHSFLHCMKINFSKLRFETSHAGAPNLWAADKYKLGLSGTRPHSRR